MVKMMMIRQSIQLKQEIIQRLAGPWITLLNWSKQEEAIDENDDDKTIHPVKARG